MNADIFSIGSLVHIGLDSVIAAVSCGEESGICILTLQFAYTAVSNHFYMLFLYFDGIHIIVLLVLPDFIGQVLIYYSDSFGRLSRVGSQCFRDGEQIEYNSCKLLFIQKREVQFLLCTDEFVK